MTDTDPEAKVVAETVEAFDTVDPPPALVPATVVDPAVDEPDPAVGPVALRRQQELE